MPATLDPLTRFVDVLTRDRALLAPRKGEGHSLIFQDYRQFLTTVADGTVRADAFGWRFWSSREIEPLHVARNRLGRAPLPDVAAAENFLVFADVDDGRRLISMRRFRPYIASPLVYANEGFDVWPIASDFEGLVQLLEKRHP